MGEILELGPSTGTALKTVDPKRIAVTPDPEKNLIDQFWDEIFQYYKVMKEFNEMDASEVFGSLSAFSARASEMRAYCNRSDSKRSQNLRLKAIDPFIEECDRQFKYHSRNLSTQEAEMRLSGGRFT